MSGSELLFDFTADKGGFLSVERDPSWSRSDLNPLELMMLQHNKIPRLLTLQLEEVDGKVRLLYDIRGKKRLADRLRRESLTQREYVELLLMAVSAWEDCAGYLLNERGLWLQADYMFTGSDFTEVHLPFLPLQSHGEVKSMPEQLRSFSALLLGSVDSMLGTSVPRVLAALREEALRPPDFKELLLKLLLEQSPAAESKARVRTDWNETADQELITSSPSIVPSSTAAKPAWLPKWEPAVGERAGQQPVKKSSSWLDRIRELKDEISATGETGLLPRPELSGRLSSEPREAAGNTRVSGAEAHLNAASSGVAQAPTERKTLLYMAALCLAVLALTWSFYSEAASKKAVLSMGIVSVLDVLVFSSFLAVRYRRRQKGGNNGGREMEGPSEVGLNIDDTADELPFTSWPVTTGISRASKDPAPIAPTPSIPPPPVRLSSATVLLEPHLLEETLTKRETGPVFWLEVTSERGTERVVLTGESFLIGRAEGGAHFPIDDAGVSKHHVELTRQGTGFHAQDLGSTNGTLLNGERMAPYKSYPLTATDTLRVLRTQFVFVQENQR